MNKKITSIALLSIALSISSEIHAQANVTYNGNSVPVGGTENTAVGLEIMFFNTGNNNTGFGRSAIGLNTTGNDNTGVGFAALYSNTTSSGAVAVGSLSLYNNTTGFYNSAVGYSALTTNTTGSRNTAIGYTGLFSNTVGTDNTSGGYRAMYANTTGSFNTATGTYALATNLSSNYNTAIGYQSAYQTTSIDNTGVGFRSIYSTQTGSDNTGLGFNALYGNTTGSHNTAVGAGADVSTTNLSNATSLGSGAVVNASNKVRFANATVTVVEGPVAYTFSDGRFKTNIKEEDVKGLEFINKLRPVVYNLDTKKITEFWTKNMPDTTRKKYMDQDFTASTNIRQSGFIAQEVADAAKSVGYDFNGVHVAADDNDNYSVAYSEMVVPLVKGMQEQQKMIDEQKQVNAEQKQMIENLQQQINDLKNQGTTTGIDQIAMAGSSMEQNVPNPFTQETVIRFNLATQFSNAYMAIYDLSGKQLKTIAITQHGASSITLTADQLTPGMYIYSIMVDGKLLDSKRMVVAGK
jgi:hypothetical protein